MTRRLRSEVKGAIAVVAVGIVAAVALMVTGASWFSPFPLILADAGAGAVLLSSQAGRRGARRGAQKA